MAKSSSSDNTSSPSSDRLRVIVERTQVSTDNANVQVTELQLSDGVRRALNLPPRK